MKLTLIPLIIGCFLATLSFGQQVNTSINLELITKVPAVIDGCSGLYTYDSVSLKKKEYIIVTDLQNVAFIKVQGHAIKLKETSQKKLPKSVFKITYQGGGYIIVLTTKTGHKEDLEFALEVGTLEITKGSIKKLIKIHGQSGC